MKEQDRVISTDILSRPNLRNSPFLLFLFIVISLLSACAFPRTSSHTARTAVEQLLLSQSAIQSLQKVPLQDMALLPGASVQIETTGFTDDQKFLKEVIKGWLGEKGFKVRKVDGSPSYRVEVIVNAFGTEQGESFFGIPAIQSTIIPFSLPELTVYRAQRQKGYVQMYFNFVDGATGETVHTTAPTSGRTHFNRYTFLFFFTVLSTNLEEVP